MEMTSTKPSLVRPHQHFLFALLGAFLVSAQNSSLFAQEQTTGGSKEEASSGLFVDRNVNTNSVLIVPFENRMYRSVADPAASRSAEMNSGEIREVYRAELIKRVQKEMEGSGIRPEGGLMEETTSERIYKGLGYNSEKVVWPEKEQKGVKKLVPKKKKKEPEERAGTYIENGQVRTVRDTSTKIMVPVILDPALQPWLQEDFGTGRILFITQFDIIPNSGLQYAGFGLDTATCVLQVHCSVFEEKKKVNSTLVRKKFRPCYSEQAEIIDMTFDPIARQIARLLTKEEEE